MIKLEIITCEQYGDTPGEACDKLYAELGRIVEITPAATGGFAARLKLMLNDEQLRKVELAPE